MRGRGACSRSVVELLLGSLAWRGFLAALGLLPGASCLLLSEDFWPALQPAYSVRTWGAEDGLPQSAVTAVTQTSNGLIWVGTYGGLAKYDGSSFEVYDGANAPDLQNSRVTSLCETADGVLWLGHETGDVSKLQRGRFSSVPSPPGAVRLERIAALACDSEGRVWAGDQTGAFLRLSDGQAAPRPESAAGSSGHVQILRDLDGNVWLSGGGVVRVVQGDQAPGPPPWEGDVSGSFVSGVCLSRRGGVWVLIDGRIRRWAASRWVEERGEFPWGQSPVTAMTETARGELAVGTLAAGLYLVPTNGPSARLDRAHGLPNDWVRCLFEDREGILWAGTGSAGLAALRPARVGVAISPAGWDGHALLAVTAQRNGALWVGTEGAGLFRWRRGAWSRFAEAEGVGNPFVWSVAEDAEGELWVGTWGGGLLRLAGDRFLPAVGLETMKAPVTALLPARQGGGVWAGTGIGLLRYDGLHCTWYGRDQGLEVPDVRTLAEDDRGVLWFGMAGGGLGRLSGGQVRQYRRRDGLSSDFVQCLFPEPDGTLWIGTADGGLNRYKDGRFSVIGVKQGLPNNVICHLAEDGLGNFWISSHGGLFRVERTELQRCADGVAGSVQGLSLGRSDGMPTLECSGGLQPAGCRTGDGRLWFPTSQGLVVLAPATVGLHPTPPPVLIEAMHADGHALPADPRSSSRLQVPADWPNLDFTFAGLSFAAPEKVRFRTRLEGLEPGWVDLAGKRTAEYARLPPGDYVFHVTACNDDGVWNPTGVTLPFTVLPHFWQTWWFGVAAGCLGLLAAATVSVGVARRRVRLHVERLDRQRAVERERARIAQDIHDDLGASLTRISLLSQSAQSDPALQGPAAAHLDQIVRTTRELTRTMDEIVWAVNPRHDTLFSLANYLGSFAQELLAAGSIRCRLDIPLDLPDLALTSETRHAVFLCFKEALNNAVKHAGATEVRVTLAFRPRGVVLSVADNGRGLPPESVTPAPAASGGRISSGHGVGNMRRRIAAVGGWCEIRNRAGGGVCAEFFIPLDHSRP